ncbi:3'-5' exonuclease [Alkalihalobacillus sp. LMS39]|uniref:3'-5' exonuclease n=1 Tax=Alkalihalobacillus sp. LMS39 TaxID=2924032 RepID=UPI001FB30E84|nr:3'-5' exonuclease [Alkalihalobacillus sp. LMS39]UOE95211.1 3'-5' exonuclease [Alkalihalobacillus sp. LMS39]
MKLTYISNEDYTLEDLYLQDIQNQKYCIFDFEATGIKYKDEYITQIGAVMFEDGQILEGKTFNSYVRSPKPIPEKVEQFTGVNNEMIKNAPDISEIYPEFLKFIGDAVLVTHAGYEFDLPLLKKECDNNNLKMLNNVTLDTKALFSYLHPEINEIIWTDFLIKFYEINDDDIKRHDALDDSIVISRIFKKILTEFEKRNIRDLDINKPINVKRFKIKPL